LEVNGFDLKRKIFKLGVGHTVIICHSIDTGTTKAIGTYRGTLKITAIHRSLNIKARI
jgi:hypothetical protein